MSVLPEIKCSSFGREIERGDRIIIVGILYGSGWTSPLGRFDKILEELTKEEGGLYCENCFKEKCPDCDPF
jgi:hypothetical protein